MCGTSHMPGEKGYDLSDAAQVLKSDAYREYHAKVVQACCELMGEDTREFWDKQCDYLEDFAEKTDPAEVAARQLEAMD